MQRVLEVRDLAIGHGGAVLLDEMSFDVHKGQVFAILGPSGLCSRLPLDPSGFCSRSLVGRGW